MNLTVVKAVIGAKANKKDGETKKESGILFKRKAEKLFNINQGLWY